MSLRRFSRKATAVLAHAGERHNVVRRSESGEDRYGGETYVWNTVGSVLGVVFYGSRSREIRAEDSGRMRSDRPHMMLPREVDVLEDDRVLVYGTEYRVDSIKTLPTHIEASLRAVTP